MSIFCSGTPVFEALYDQNNFRQADGIENIMHSSNICRKRIKTEQKLATESRIKVFTQHVFVLKEIESAK